MYPIDVEHYGTNIIFAKELNRYQFFIEYWGPIRMWGLACCLVAPSPLNKHYIQIFEPYRECTKPPLFFRIVIHRPSCFVRVVFFTLRCLLSMVRFASGTRPPGMGTCVIFPKRDRKWHMCTKMRIGVGGGEAWMGFSGGSNPTAG